MFHVKHSLRRSIRCGDFFRSAQKLFHVEHPSEKFTLPAQEHPALRPKGPFRHPWAMFHVKHRFFGTFENTRQSLAALGLRGRSCGNGVKIKAIFLFSPSIRSFNAAKIALRFLFGSAFFLPAK
jgi:hypothetical protein